MPAYRVLIVEDEPKEAATIRGFVETYALARDLHVGVTWHADARNFVNEGGKYDLIFMDIDLPGMSGMDAAQLLRVYDRITPIIFVTNLAQYAIRGYEVNALDFVVEPMRYPDFEMRMDRAMRKIVQKVDRPIVINDAGVMRIIALPDIDHVEAANHDIVVHLIDEEPLCVRGKLADIEAEGVPLLRISKSCVVNMDNIRQVDGARITTFGGAELRISRTRRSERSVAIAKYLGSSL